ncbi:hypothetical protein [Actinomadura rubrisoli]|uniref:Uncharacterized protein n=1 Tax=Actinomadura rubrisoli TaxID=2530368 RepID=A0A4R5BGB7_9ACTN|nr:hypothetical protein [Actinomadura rubrisoli]TDD83940.1 hypothetical protein E1298_20565 [Actinomadura rubrisoli]
MTTDTPDAAAHHDLQHAIAAYQLLMDEIVPESQYWQGKREDPDKIRYLGDIITRAAARARERRRTA